MQSILSHFSAEVVRQVFELGSTTDSNALNAAREYFASEAFFNGWAAYIVVSNALDIGIADLTPEQIHAKAEIVRKVFPVPFKLMSALLQKLTLPRPANIASEGAKRWNFVWDSMIAFSIGPGTIDEASVFLVTGDKEITAAAREAGYAEQVLSLEDHLNSVGMR